MVDRTPRDSDYSAEELATRSYVPDGKSTETTLSSSSTATPEALPPVPGYEIVRILGHGGMGVVYEARQGALKRSVALKMIVSGGQASGVERKRFHVEAESVARLRHPNIVQIYEVGEYEGRPFFTVEYMEGGNLALSLRGELQSPERAAALCQTLAQAVQYAHEQGIVHRDLKPANVLLSADGTPKIADFGLAKQLGQDSEQTHTGAVLGTPSYMAPEQAAGHARDVGPAADVYALGAILYELLTGRPPFRGASMLETLQQVREQEPVAPSRLQAGVPRDLETICLKCLEKAPGRRYGSAGDLAADLRRFQAHEPIVARPSSAWERAWKWAKRKPAVAALLAALLLVFAVGLGGVIWQLHETELARQDAEQEADRAGRAEKLATEKSQLAIEKSQLAEQKSRLAEKNATQAQEAKIKADQAAENRRRDLYVAHMNLVQRAWERSDVLHVQDLLRRQLPQPGQADLREFEWYYYQGMTQHGHVLRNLPPVRSLAWSPDGKILAIGCFEWGRASVYLWDAVSRTPPVLLAQNSKLFSVNSLAFNHAGTMLAVGLGTFWKSPEAPATVPGVIEVWHLPVSLGDLKAPSRLARTLTGHKYPVMGLAFTRDGGLVSVGADLKDGGNGVGPVRIYDWDKNARGEIKLWDVTASKEIPRFPGDLPAMTAMALALDGRRLVTGGLDGRVTMWEIEKGKEVYQLSIPGMPIWALALDNMGNAGHLAVGGGYPSRPGLLRVWDLNDTAKEPRLLIGHSGGVFCLSYGPDFLLSSGFDRTTNFWKQRDTEITTFRGHNSFVLAQALAPDGRSVATGGLDRRCASGTYRTNGRSSIRWASGSSSSARTAGTC